MFQSCTSVRDDPQFTVQLASKPPSQSAVQDSHCRNRSVSIEELLLQGSLVAPGMEIPPKQAKQVIIVFNAKYEAIITHLCFFSSVQVWIQGEGEGGASLSTSPPPSPSP